MAKTNLAIHPGIIALLWRVSSCVIGPRRSAAQVAACTATATPEWRRDTHFKLSVFILTVGLVFFSYLVHCNFFASNAYSTAGLNGPSGLEPGSAPPYFLKEISGPARLGPLAAQPVQGTSGGKYWVTLRLTAETVRTKDQSIAVQMSYHSTTTCL